MLGLLFSQDASGCAGFRDLHVSLSMFFFLLLPRAVHGSWVHVLKIVWFAREAYKRFWCLRNGGMEGSPLQLWWFGRPQGLQHFFI